MSQAIDKSILVIDDDDVYRRRLARAFGDRDYSVSEASNGEEAIGQLRSQRPKFVVLDLKIGTESGLIILPQLLEIDPTLAVVVLTGYGTISTAVEALKLGARNYLVKPVDADGILAAFLSDSASNDLKLETPRLEQVEWDHIQRVMRDNEGNISKASKELGLHRRSLQRKLSKAPPKLK